VVVAGPLVPVIRQRGQNVGYGHNAPPNYGSPRGIIFVADTEMNAKY